MIARFTADEADAAQLEWGFNCGPGALCGVLGMTPAELRPHLRDFEAKRYTNPTLMFGILDDLRVQYWQTYKSDAPDFGEVWPTYGLVRVQWAGSWTQPGVPMGARYRRSHWIGVDRLIPGIVRVFDVNAMLDGGWLGFEVWKAQLVPWLLQECVPRATGEWWPTNVIEVAVPKEK